MLRTRTLLWAGLWAGLFTLAWGASASAQVVELIVPQIGVTFVNYSGDDIDSDTGIGFEAGGKVRAGGRLYIEAGFFWSTAGADVTIPAGGATTDDLRIQDVSFPIAIDSLPPDGDVLANDEFGIVKEELKGTLWSGRAGLGFDFVVLSFDAGYDFGLGNIFEVGAESVKRSEWFIELGARFGF